MRNRFAAYYFYECLLLCAALMACIELGGGLSDRRYVVYAIFDYATASVRLMFTFIIELLWCGIERFE